MFERFTDRARRVVVLSQEEARALNHNYIGTEHILLGLIHEGEGVAAMTLESLGFSLEGVREQVEQIIGRGQQTPSGHIPFTPRAKTVLELSLREALQLGHNYIGTEHILLGLVQEGKGVGAQILVKLGGNLILVRQRVIQLLSGKQGSEPAPAAHRAPRVFICYRREDSAWVAGRVFDELVRQLGPDTVFMDVDSIEPGRDFVDATMAAVSACDFVLVLIGPRWLQSTTADGQRRLDQAGDYVVTELAAALSLGKRIVPALIEGATMPRADQLPPSIAELARRNAVRLEHIGFHDHIRNLVRLFTPRAA